MPPKEDASPIDDHIEYLPPISLSILIIFFCLNLYFFASLGFAVIAIKLSALPDHSSACFSVSIVSSVLNDFEDTIKTVESLLHISIFSENSPGSEPVTNNKFLRKTLLG